MPHWHQILVIFMIYAIFLQIFVVRIYAPFPQISLDWKTDSQPKDVSVLVAKVKEALKEVVREVVEGANNRKTERARWEVLGQLPSSVEEGAKKDSR